MQKLRHQPHWLQHGNKKASEVSAARAQGGCCSTEGSAARRPTAPRRGLWREVRAPAADIAPTGCGVYSIIWYKEHIVAYEVKAFFLVCI